MTPTNDTFALVNETTGQKIQSGITAREVTSAWPVLERISQDLRSDSPKLYEGFSKMHKVASGSGSSA